MKVTFRDDVQGFVSKWDNVLLSMKETPNENFSESIKKHEGARFRTIEDHLCLGHTVHKGEPESYARLENVVKMYFDQKTMDRNCDARNDMPASGAPIRRKGDDRS